jgi:hypothetical protein
MKLNYNINIGEQVDGEGALDVGDQVNPME